MEIVYDAEVDVLRIRLNSKPIEESDENEQGVIIDYASDGSIVAFEVLEVCTKVHRLSE